MTDKLVEALKFYADPANYIDAQWSDGSEDGCDIPNAIPAISQEGVWFCDCGDIARAALADTPASAAEPMGWQPIETAPKDGTLIILHDAARVASGVGRWRQVASHDTLNDIDGVAQFRREYGWRSASDKAITNPTHWMSFPSLPGTVDT